MGALFHLLHVSKRTKRQTITAICYGRKGEILSVGRNSYVKTHPLQAKLAREAGEPSRIYLHAEVAAIVKVRDWSLIKRMAVIRLNGKGKELDAKPCPICQSLIDKIGISEVVYTTRENV